MKICQREKGIKSRNKEVKIKAENQRSIKMTGCGMVKLWEFKRSGGLHASSSWSMVPLTAGIERQLFDADCFHAGVSLG